MTRTREGFLCPRCGTAVHAKPETEPKKEKTRNSFDYVYVSENQKDNYAKIARECPKCGNKKAFHWFSGVSGEHAGVRQERTVEHFRCTICSYTWVESS